jgi:hypothetical protein
MWIVQRGRSPQKVHVVQGYFSGRTLTNGGATTQVFGLVRHEGRPARRRHHGRGPGPRPRLGLLLLATGLGYIGITLALWFGWL